MQSNALNISIKSITKTYGDFHALNDVNLEVNSGEFLTLLGPSGSGKTTLLMVLAGFTRPDYGSVKFGEEEVILKPPHLREIGMVFQNYALFPHMDVAPMYKNNEIMNHSTAFRNSSLQGAYFMMVSRALGLDCGPMSGFNNALVDEIFFNGTNIKSNFLCCIGYGDPSKIFMRLPRLDFDEVCEII